MVSLTCHLYDVVLLCSEFRMLNKVLQIIVVWMANGSQREIPLCYYFQGLKSSTTSSVLLKVRKKTCFAFITFNCSLNT